MDPSRPDNHGGHMLSLVVSLTVTGYAPGVVSPAAGAAAMRSVSPRLQQNNPLQGAAVAGAAQAAATVMEEVSKSVSSNGVEAPEAKSSFVSMDSERAGLVDDDGLPLIYDKNAIQKYWEGHPGIVPLPHQYCTPNYDAQYNTKRVVVLQTNRYCNSL